MASQVLSGSSNPSYTNNTGQNVRLLINYMTGCTSMTWAGVTVTGSSTVVSKDTLEILGEFKSADTSSSGGGPLSLSSVTGQKPNAAAPVIRLSSNALDHAYTYTSDGVTANGANIFYVPTSIRPGGTFPTEIILANDQSYSAICGAYNIVVIREDGN